MDHIVWINWKDYTAREFFFYGLGCFFWVIAYAIYIRNIIRYKYVEMPVFAGCCDVGWEFTWSFLAVNNMGMLFQAANYVWFALDMGFIFTYGVLVFGWKQLTVPRLQKRSLYVPACLGIAAFAATVTYFMYKQGLDNAVGGRSAYLIQLTISFLYIPLMLRQEDLSHFSYAANWLRALGSAMVVVFFYLHYPEDTFLLTIGTVAAIVDGTFLYLFAQRRRELEARVSSPALGGALGLPGDPASPVLP
jgi:hypothetical protein